MTGWVVVRGADNVFAALAENRRIRLDAEVRELVLIAQACDEWTIDESRVDQACEKLINGGAPGTALVGEFLALELAGLLEVSPVAAALRVREVLDLRHRHPELWGYMLAGGVAPWRAVQVAARCSAAGLSVEAARWVDHQVCVALVGLPFGRVLRSLEGLIVRADAALAAERAELARLRRRVWVGDHAQGQSVLWAQLDTEDALALDQTISDVANALASLGCTDPVDVRRATALGVLADPQAAWNLLTGNGDGTPTNRAATVIVHVAADTVLADTVLANTLLDGAVPTDTAPDDAVPTDTVPTEAVAAGVVPGHVSGVARVEGIGPLDPVTLRRFLGSARVVVRPVIDLNTVPPVDAYEVPDRLRDAVLARNPVEVFPFSARRATGLDMDHTIAYDHHAPPGTLQTRADNLGPLSRKVHRAKTAGLWRVVQTDPGEYRWTSPHGFAYLVTPDATIPLGRHPDRQAEPLAPTG